MPSATGYMMNAGHFSENLVSSGDLNRPRESRGPQPSACFCGTFCTPQKVPIRFPFGKASRFCKPRISAPKQRLRTNPIKSFCRPCLPPHGRLAHVRSQFSLFRRSPTHKNLPQATFCTSEHVLFGYFLHNAKSDKPYSLAGRFEVLRTSIQLAAMAVSHKPN